MLVLAHRALRIFRMTSKVKTPHHDSLQKLRIYLLACIANEVLQLVSYQGRTLDLVVVDNKKLGPPAAGKLSFRHESQQNSTLHIWFASLGHRLAGYRFAFNFVNGPHDGLK
jgi:hypothetical protein